MGYNLPKHTLHDNVSDKETSCGDSKHHVHSGWSCQTGFRKWSKLSNLFGAIRHREPLRDIWDQSKRKETINESKTSKILHQSISGAKKEETIFIHYNPWLKRA